MLCRITYIETDLKFHWKLNRAIETIIRKSSKINYQGDMNSKVPRVNKLDSNSLNHDPKKYVAFVPKKRVNESSFWIDEINELKVKRDDAVSNLKNYWLQLRFMGPAFCCKEVGDGCFFLFSQNKAQSGQDKIVA